MRKQLSLSLAVGLVLSISAAAAAAPLASATLSFQIGSLPPATFVGIGATGTATSNLFATLDAGTSISGAVTTTIPTSAFPPLSQVRVAVTKNATLGFSGGSTPGAFTGVANLKFGGGFTLLNVPLKIGAPGTIAVAAYGVNLTAISASWTVGATTLTLGPTTTAMATGFNGLTGGGFGTLVLVTPVKIITNLGNPIAAFGVLMLNYVPEPGTLLLLGMGMASLAAIGRRHM